jgi:hypothetical protein
VPPPSIKSPTPGAKKAGHEIPAQPISKLRKAEQYSAGKPSKHDKAKLMRSDGIIPIQAGSNKHASQKGMTGLHSLRIPINFIQASVFRVTSSIR